MGSLFIVGSIDFQDGEKQHHIIQGNFQDDKNSEVHEEILPNGVDEVESHATKSIGV